MKNGLIFISVLLVLSLIFNVFQYINEKNYRDRQEKWEVSPDDSVFIDRVVDIYDSFVRSNMGNEMPIDEAYHRFMDSFGMKALERGDVGLLAPDSLPLFQWAYDLISNKQSNSFFEVDYINPLPETLSYATPEWPAGWHLSITSKFVDFMKTVGKHNEFWYEYADATEAAGSLDGVFISGTVYGNKDIDFSNKYERFLVAIPFMDGGCYYARPFTLEIDLRRNDSLKKVLWNQ